MSDSYEARIGFWASFLRITHSVVCEGIVIGRVYDDCTIIIQTAPQVSAAQSGGDPQA